jgi:hypothetical protein
MEGVRVAPVRQEKKGLHPLIILLIILGAVFIIVPLLALGACLIMFRGL